MKNLNNIRGASNRFRFEKLPERLSRSNIDVVHRIRAIGSLDDTLSKTPDAGDKGCFFQDELERLKEIETCSAFKRYFIRYFWLIQNLQLLLDFIIRCGHWYNRSLSLCITKKTLYPRF